MQITTFNPMILTSIENSERANDKMFLALGASGLLCVVALLGSDALSLS